MSWYSKVYTYVREYRRQKPVRGFFLHIALNSMLVLQIIIICYAYFVYTWVLCFHLLVGFTQITIYLIIYNSVFILFCWSLIQSMRTPTARVPPEYYVEEKIDKSIKAATPMANGRYIPDMSTPEQIKIQNKIMNDFVNSRGLKFVEVDKFNRLRYCYMCGLVKPDRCHHCMSCGACVVKFDHHCPWINKCISHSNYKFFVLYLFYGVVLISWMALTSIEALVRYFIDQNWLDDLSYFLMVATCMTASTVLGYFLYGEMLVYHAKLIVINETTMDQAKTPLIRGDSKADYNVGRYRNLRCVLGWGLWMFPVSTHVGNGLHYSIRYTDKCTGEKWYVQQEKIPDEEHRLERIA